MKNTDVNTILKSCRKSESFYLVPPLGLRINFHSQQLRALNLVMALHHGSKPKIPKGRQLKVAVIGAGLAGITAAVGLICKGHKVVVYEESSEALHRQSSAAHRMLHPTVNFWPDHDSELISSTILPFFDWAQGNCEDVVAYLQKEWKTYVATHKDVLDFQHSSVVTNVQPSSKGCHKIWLDTGIASEGDFDLVIATAGFRDEKAPVDFPTPLYWDPDDLMKKIKDPKKPSFAVSGAGDGGLIDALRSLYEFDKGALAFRVAELLQGTRVAELLSEAEDTLQTLARDEDSMSESQKEDANRSITNLYDQAQELFVQAETCDQFKDLTACLGSTACGAERMFSCRLAQARDLLVESSRSKRTLTLIDNAIDNIALSKAAPVHKFLIRVAIGQGRVQFETGELEIADGKRVLRRPNGSGVVLENDVNLYARHGAQTNFEAILKEKDKTFFHKGRSWLADANVEQHFKDDEFVHPVVSIAPDSHAERAGKRKARVGSTLSKLDENMNEGGNRIVEIVMSDQSQKEAYAYYGDKIVYGLPNGKIFGVEIGYAGSTDTFIKTEMH